MIYLAIALAALIALFAWVVYSTDRERRRREEAFARERGVWVRERRDLNNRIQIPQAAPFIAEAEEEPDPNDLPLPPEFAVDQGELEQAMKELEAVGYEDGPAT